MSRRLGCATIACILSLAAWSHSAHADVADPPKVAVVVGPAPSELEHYAVDRLCDYLAKLYGIKTVPSTEVAKSAEVALVVGAPGSNPTARKALGPDGWPRLSEQGIVLKRATLEGKPALVIGGGSPRATMWAA